MKNEVICWPDSNERVIISSRFARKGFLGCILTKDGSHINFNKKSHVDEKFHVDGEVRFNRKSRYSMNILLSCDDEQVIRNLVLGWPGSVYDGTIDNTTQQAKTPNLFFDLGQYEMTYAGFSLSSHNLTPYRQPACCC
jgi:hypothetical protein